MTAREWRARKEVRDVKRHKRRQECVKRVDEHEGRLLRVQCGINIEVDYPCDFWVVMDLIDTISNPSSHGADNFLTTKMWLSFRLRIASAIIWAFTRQCSCRYRSARRFESTSTPTACLREPLDLES